MAVLFTTFEVNPQDLGYVIVHDHHDDGSVADSTVPVNDPAAPAAVVNFATVISKLHTARDVVNANYLALANPTNAQNAAQVQAVTKELNALILLVLHAVVGLGSVAGT